MAYKEYDKISVKMVQEINKGFPSLDKSRMSIKEGKRGPLLNFDAIPEQLKQIFQSYEMMEKKFKMEV